MLAKSHVSIGFLASLLMKVPLQPGPTAAILVAFNLVPGLLRFILLAVLLALAIALPEKAGPFLIPFAVLVGSIIADLDDPNSTASLILAPTGLVIRLSLVAVGGVIIWQGWGITWVMVLGCALILTGLLNLKILPMKKIQRAMLILAGIALIAWAYSKLTIALGVIYLLMGVLSHRGLTHSLEGVALAIVGAWCFSLNAGHPELLKPFMIGYVSHYLADAVSNGVYLTYIGKVRIGVSLIKTSSLIDRGIGLMAMTASLLICIGGMGKFTSLLNWGFSKLN